MLSVGAFVTCDINQILVFANPTMTHNYQIDQNGTVLGMNGLTNANHFVTYTKVKNCEVILMSQVCKMIRSHV
jgi:hypothetical protein